MQRTMLHKPGVPQRGIKTRNTSSRAILSGFVPLLFLYGLYTVLRWTFIERASTIGDHNALNVMRFERWLGIDWETWIQHHLLQRPETTWLVNHYYVYAFFPVLIASALLAARRAPGAFQRWRTIFVASLGFALIGFALFPLTPPRLLDSGYGFIDSLMLTGPRYYGDESGSSLFNLYGSIPSMVNEYAAMPSMHVGWSAVAAALVIAAFPKRKAVWLLALAHVMMMQLAVVATGNHYLIDGIVGLIVVAVSWAIVTHGLPRVRVWLETSMHATGGFSVCGE